MIRADHHVIRRFAAYPIQKFADAEPFDEKVSQSHLISPHGVVWYRVEITSVIDRV